MAGQTHRLYAVLSKRLDGRKFICGQLSIADFMIWLWIAPRKNQGIILGEFLHLRCGSSASARVKPFRRASNCGRNCAPAGGKPLERLRKTLAESCLARGGR